MTTRGKRRKLTGNETIDYRQDIGFYIMRERGNKGRRYETPRQVYTLLSTHQNLQFTKRAQDHLPELEEYQTTLEARISDTKS